MEIYFLALHLFSKAINAHLKKRTSGFDERLNRLELKCECKS